MHFGMHQVLFSGDGGNGDEIGEFVIHIECPWTWTKNGVELANQDSDSGFIDLLAKSPVACKSASTNDDWITEIRFEDDSTLTIQAQPRAGLRRKEYWRLMEPAEDRIHISVGSESARS